jgi:hypothetical protein
MVLCCWGLDANVSRETFLVQQHETRIAEKGGTEQPAPPESEGLRASQSVIPTEADRPRIFFSESLSVILSSPPFNLGDGTYPYSVL